VCGVLPRRPKASRVMPADPDMSGLVSNSLQLCKRQYVYKIKHCSCSMCRYIVGTTIMPQQLLHTSCIHVGLGCVPMCGTSGVWG
jgi:hypothetical protein